MRIALGLVVKLTLRQLGFNFNLTYLAGLATLKNLDTTKQSVCG